MAQKVACELTQGKDGSEKILFDDSSCIKISKNRVFHDWSKHIYIKCHFIRDYVQRGAVQLQCTPTGEQVADILTKVLGKTKFVYFREKMVMIKNPFQQQKWTDAELRGSCSTDEAVAVAVSWAAVQKATMEQMRGNNNQASTTQRLLQGQISMQQENCQNTFLAKSEC